MEFFPQVLCMAPRRTMDRPTVRRMRTRGFREREGRRPANSTSIPARVTPATATGRAAVMGNLALTSVAYRSIPPRETKSTWVKFTIPMVLWTTPNPMATMA